MDPSEAFSIIGPFGKGHVRIVGPVAAVSQIFMAFFMCGGIFTLYANKEGDKVQIDSVYKEFNLTKLEANAINSAVMLGVLLGNLAFGKLADIYGRKPLALIVMSFAILVNILATILTFDAISYGLWRLLLGFFNGGLTVSLAVISFELIGKEYWGYCGILMSAFFAVGIFILAMLAKVFTHWRSLTIVTSVPMVVVVYLLYRMPESPRWLYSVGRVDEAEEVMYRLGLANGKSREQLLQLKLRRNSFSLNNSQDQITPTSDTTLDMIKSRPVLVRLLVMLVTWFSNSLIYYGLTLGAGDLGNNIYQNTIFTGLSEMPGYLFAIVLMENKFFGRRRTCIMFLIICGFASLCIDAFNLSGSSKLCLALGSKMLIAGTFGIIYPYTCELFPTTIRSMSLGLCSVLARFGGILSPFAISLGGFIHKDDENSGFLLYSICAIFSGICCVFIPETLGRDLSDNIKELERRSRRNERISDENGENVDLLSD